MPCEECAVVKSTTLSTIGSSLMDYDSLLHLVVADLCGAFQVRSIDVFEFSLEIRDVFSTFLMNFLLKHEDEGPGRIKSYIAEAERRTGSKVIFWRTNGGGEFLNESLKKYFSEKGISVQTSMTYAHKQNSIIERSNGTVQATMQVFLRDLGTERNFGGLAMLTGTYLLDRTPNVNTGGKTLHQQFFGTVPQAEHLRVFGSWAFVHVPQEQPNKLDDRALKCRFGGYVVGMKGWKFWNPIIKSFLISSHARWLDEKGQSVTSTSHPIHDPESSSSLDRIFNAVSTFGLNFEVQQLFESLKMEFKLEYGFFTRTVQEQDKIVEEIFAMSAGLVMDIPKTYTEVVTGAHGNKWEAACKKEIDMLIKMNLREEVLLPKGQKVVSSKWTFAHKMDA